jgi:hypothetical protein
MKTSDLSDTIKLEIYFTKTNNNHNNFLNEILDLISSRENNKDYINWREQVLTKEEKLEYYKKLIGLMKKANFDELKKCPECNSILIKQGIDKKLECNILKCEKCNSLYFG